MKLLPRSTVAAALGSRNWIFTVCAPPPVRYAPPVTEQVPLHSKSPSKNKAGASEGCK